MKVGIIVKPNQKGQIVIPKKIRETLNINQDVPLNVSLKGNSIYVSPIHSITNISNTSDSYLKILGKTQGSWQKENLTKLVKRRRKIEIEAARKRRRTW